MEIDIISRWNLKKACKFKQIGIVGPYLCHYKINMLLVKLKVPRVLLYFWT